MALDYEKTCDLCGGSNFDVISRRDRKQHELYTGVCTRCGLVCHMEIPTEEQLNDFYADNYRAQYHGETTPSARRVLRAWNNGQRIVRQLKPYLNSEDAIFEVGAGIGCTVKACQLEGFRARGVEPSDGFHGYSTDKLASGVERGFLYDLPTQPTYDVVLLVHVIEHFRSPRAALDHIHAIMKPGGRLYIECPNLGAPFATRKRLFHFAHIHNFTPATLIMMARRCGFSVEARMSDDDDPNLQVLFTRREDSPLEIDADAFRQAMSALSRYNWLTYHLRARYVSTRVRKIASYVAEHITAGRQVARIEAACQSARGEAGAVAHRRAA